MEGCLDWSYVLGEMCAKFKHGRSPIRHTTESLYTRNLICMATTMLELNLPEKSAEVNYCNFSTSYPLHLEAGRLVKEPVLLRKFEDVKEFVLINHQKALKTYWRVCVDWNRSITWKILIWWVYILNLNKMAIIKGVFFTIILFTLITYIWQL